MKTFDLLEQRHFFNKKKADISTKKNFRPARWKHFR